MSARALPVRPSVHVQACAANGAVGAPELANLIIASDNEGVLDVLRQARHAALGMAGILGLGLGVVGAGACLHAGRGRQPCCR